MQTEYEMQQIKGRIAEVYARREHLKRALASGEMTPRTGLAQLDATDRKLSELDSRYKLLWDATQAADQSRAMIQSSRCGIAILQVPEIN